MFVIVEERGVAWYGMDSDPGCSAKESLPVIEDKESPVNKKAVI
jgi:hypothetical protein